MPHFKNEPLKVSLKADTKYALCCCGESKKFPFCDGKHREAGGKPIKFFLEKDEEVSLCQCSKSKTLPYCDKSHNK